ncbi:exostosin-3-like isoform X1 [Amphibalanus amphitrite]|uniref:exostosin-3-like isoform X1 n=1 Tax=Amphibalanus amphitrite TaxID=1232801 RepID=UPI001C9281D2|nr:exostosin-3-like isoform X1 [Amphibalanus amphitrite]
MSASEMAFENEFHHSRTQNSCVARAISYLIHMKLSTLVLILIFLLILIPLMMHYYVSQILVHQTQVAQKAHPLVTNVDLNSDSSAHLKGRIDEMNRIKNSVSNELLQLEAKRNKLHQSLETYSGRVDELKQQLSRLQLEYERLKYSVERARAAELEAAERDTPLLARPRPLRAEPGPRPALEPPPAADRRRCTLPECWDYSRCPITGGFSFHLYRPLSDASDAAASRLLEALRSNAQWRSDPAAVCAYVLVVGGAPEPARLQRLLTAAEHWSGDGRNHVLVAASAPAAAALDSVDTGRAVLVRTPDAGAPPRPGFDLVLPSVDGPLQGVPWQTLPPLVPARRPVLVSFQGELAAGQRWARTDELTSSLQSLSQSHTRDVVHTEFRCPEDAPAAAPSSVSAAAGGWRLCGSAQQRSERLGNATFALLLPPGGAVQQRLTEALRAGAVPVLLGEWPLPFDGVLDWRRAVLRVAEPRVRELHYMLRSLTDGDILSYRRNGRELWEHYLSSAKAVSDALLTQLAERLELPPPAAAAVPAQSVFNDTFQRVTVDVQLSTLDLDEYLGPIETPHASAAYQRNLTTPRLDSYARWNLFLAPHRLYPAVPYGDVLPAEAKFVGPRLGFRPVAAGEGGSGKEFSESLGGNSPHEQFTVVMLTYRREQVLLSALGHLYGLPYLNKVVVVWNTPEPPADTLQWPNVGVPVEVVRVGKNSLNNRFLPFDAIETDAVLSIDDDAHLRHDEIVFGFRVWREQRDRLVGFPGRFNAWDTRFGGWHYNSNYSCELSMVLTGAAFFHKYYAHMYSEWMPQVIRDKVDEYMNCEDIAMNFLISHLTRQPPVKVTSRWTFRCPGCPVTLSEDEEHFTERHKCINFFSRVFGYMPLLNTQFRVDSVLFKTRLPQDKQKCFRFI